MFMQEHVRNASTLQGRAMIAACAPSTVEAARPLRSYFSSPAVEETADETTPERPEDLVQMLCAFPLHHGPC